MDDFTRAVVAGAATAIAVMCLARMAERALDDARGERLRAQVIAGRDRIERVKADAVAGRFAPVTLTAIDQGATDG